MRVCVLSNKIVNDQLYCSRNSPTRQILNSRELGDKIYNIMKKIVYIIYVYVIYSDSWCYLSRAKSKEWLKYDFNAWRFQIVDSTSYIIL